jgi:Holliday junction resolvase RusA-like endonuclease
MGSAPPFEGPLLLEMVAYFPIVKSSRKRDIPAMIEGWIRPTKKPDLSNILKSAEDGLKGIVFVDDAQVVEIRTRKVYAHEPRVWIRITEWSPTQ